MAKKQTDRKKRAYNLGRTEDARCRVTPETKAQLQHIKQVTGQSAADLLTKSVLIRYQQITQTNKPL